jgi:two-component sensor histidine kinase
LQTNWQFAELDILVNATLSSYGTVGQANIVTGGSSVQLTPKQSLGLSLALYELGTNAVSMVRCR